MWRQITGKVRRTNDEPWINSQVRFRRSTGSFTSEAQYPSDTLTFSTNHLGELVDCRLWVNETGDRISNYVCYIGSESFTFSIPEGDGSPIALSFLRAGSLPVDEYPQSLIDYIDLQVGSITSSNYQDFITTANQTVFALPITPSAPSKTRVYLNGLKQKFGLDYNINASILNWISSQSLQNNYYLEIYY
jgi:hypothetical protein